MLIAQHNRWHETSTFAMRRASLRLLSALSLFVGLFSACDQERPVSPQQETPPKVELPRKRPEDSLPFNAVVDQVMFRFKLGDNRKVSRDAMETELASLDKELEKSPTDPRVWWWRWPALMALGRIDDARATRARAIQLSKDHSQFRVLLPDYYLEEARETAERGDPARTAENFLLAFYESPRAADEYSFLGEILLTDKDKRAAKSAAGKVHPDMKWGMLNEFFSIHQPPHDIESLRQRSKRIEVGMPYTEVPSILGFPSSKCFEHADNLPARYCWLYHLNRGTVSPTDMESIVVYHGTVGPGELHVQIAGDRVSGVILNERQ